MTEVSDDMVIVPIPPLAAILYRREQDKGAPLNEAEVVEIRDKAVCMTMPRSVALEVAEKRGYRDLDLSRVWEDWCALRDTL